MNIVIIDNYDSFTFNLVHYVEQFADNLDVIRNDKVEINQLDKYDKIILSPGPGLPSEVKTLEEIILKYCSTKPILGVCLGHQAIAETFGAKLINLKKVVHGEQRNTKIISEDYIFNNIPKDFQSGRYHSWVVSNKDLPTDIQITAIDDDNTIMALSHKKYDIKGVQFHPESIMTEFGLEIIKNWVRR